MPSRHRPGDPDDELVARVRAGDVSAMEEILRRHQPTIHAVCSRIVIDRGGAEDATQEAMIAIARAVGRFDGRSSLSTWIYRIATNASLDEVRRVRRRPRPATVTDIEAGSASATATAGAVAGPEDAHALRDEVSRALRTLTPEIRATMALRHLAGLDYAEIARALSTPIGTVRSRLARGREAMREVLDSDLGRRGNSGAGPERQTDDADGRD